MAREIDHITPILSYLKKNLAKGYKIQNLRWALINEGYSKTEVEKAIRVLGTETEREQKEAEIKQRRESAKQAVSLINDEMPSCVEEEGLWSKIKSWFS